MWCAVLWQRRGNVLSMVWQHLLYFSPPISPMPNAGAVTYLCPENAPNVKKKKRKKDVKGA